MTLASCGTASLTSSSGQRFQDGIYTEPGTGNRDGLLASKAETDELINKTKSSEIYLNTTVAQGTRTDTLYIPEDKSAVINFSGTGTSVTITDDPFDQTYFSIYPWTYTYSSLYWSPWRYGYWGFYDPWFWDWPYYYSSWYWAWDPWFYDPWFWGPAYPWYPHYSGWYGGWGPGLGWHGHWHGHVYGGHGRNIVYGHRGAVSPVVGAVSSHRPRTSSFTNSRRAMSGTRYATSDRSGITRSSSVSRRTAASAGRPSSYRTASSSRRPVSGNRTGIVATGRPSARPGSGSSIHSGSMPSSNTGTAYIGGRRSVQSYRGTSSAMYRNSAAATQSSYRRPASSYSRQAISSGPSSRQYNGSTSYRSAGGSSYRSYGNSSFNRSSSPSGFNRSTTVSRPTSSFNRSSSFSGSRSSGFSGGSRSGGGSSSVRRR